MSTTIINTRVNRNIRFFFFIAGLSNLIRFSGSVQIIPIELVALSAGLFSVLNPLKRKYEVSDLRILKFLDLFCTFSILNQLIVDSFNDIDFSETLKSCAQLIVMWALIRVAIIYTQPDYFRFIYYVSGFLISVSLQYFFDPTIYMLADPWKFALGPTITGLYFLLISSKISTFANTILSTFLISIDVLLGSRSLALFTFLALLLTLKSQKTRSRSIGKLVVIIASIMVLMFCVERIYHHLSTTGSLGRSQQVKALDQYSAGPIVFTGRSEIAFELAAIKSNPVFGSGSNPEITIKILNDTQKINEFLGVHTLATNAYKDVLENGEIPQHSVLLSAWVEGGLILFFFWIIIFVWAIRKFTQISKTLPPFGRYATYVGLSSIWAMIFSPLGAGSRMDLAIGLVAILFQSKFGNNAIKR